LKCLLWGRGGGGIASQFGLLGVQVNVCFNFWGSTIHELVIGYPKGTSQKHLNCKSEGEKKSECLFLPSALQKYDFF
jgi:hypothetical protein